MTTDYGRPTTASGLHAYRLVNFTLKQKSTLLYGMYIYLGAQAQQLKLPPDNEKPPQRMNTSR